MFESFQTRVCERWGGAEHMCVLGKIWKNVFWKIQSDYRSLWPGRVNLSLRSNHTVFQNALHCLRCNYFNKLAKCKLVNINILFINLVLLHYCCLLALFVTGLDESSRESCIWCSVFESRSMRSTEHQYFHTPLPVSRVLTSFVARSQADALDSPRLQVQRDFPRCLELRSLRSFGQ